MPERPHAHALGTGCGDGPLDRTVLSYRAFPGGAGCLLLLHGVLATHHYFSGPLGGRLGGVRLLLPDLLGSGESAKPEAEYSLQEHLSPLTDLLAREGFPEPLFLGGHSLGCLLSTALAARLPQGRVRGLVFLNYPRFTSSAHVHATLRAGSREYRQATDGVASADDRALIEASGAMVRQFAALLPEALQEEARRTSPGALAGTTRHCLFAYAPDPDLDRIATLPMLQLHGALDRVAPASSIWERRADFPNARWVLLEDAGHHLLHTHAEKAVEVIRGFLEDPGG